MTTAARQPGIFNRKSSGLVTWPSLPGGATAVVDPHRTIPARQSKRTSCCAYTEAFLVIEQQLLSLRGVAHPHFPTKEMMNVRGREMKLSIYLRCAAGVLTSIAPIGLANAEPLAQGPSIPAERGLQLLGDEPSYLDLGVGVFSCHPPRRHRYPTAAIRKFTDSPLEGDGFELPVRVCLSPPPPCRPRTRAVASGRWRTSGHTSPSRTDPARADNQHFVGHSFSTHPQSWSGLNGIV